MVRRIPAISIKFTEEVRNDMGQHSEMDQSSVLIKDEPCKEEGTQGSKTGMHTQEIKIRDGDSTGKGGGRRRRRKRAPAQK